MHGSLLDFSSWSSLLTTVASLLLITLLMVGIRLVFMQTLQKRRERENRQINERLKTLIAAYKTLGGSFTGSLQVSPVHLRDLHTPPRLQTRDGAEEGAAESSAHGDRDNETAIDHTTDGTDADGDGDTTSPLPSTSERQRRMRDAVEAALSDVILLGTEAQVRLAAEAAQAMVEGRSIETAALVASLRQFIRAALDLEPIPPHIPIPSQGPTRTASGAGGARSRAQGGSGAGGTNAGAAGGGKGGGQGGGGASLGMGMGLGGLRRGEGADPE